jgi:hypothetical protein
MEDRMPFMGNNCYIKRPTSLAGKFCNVANQDQSHTASSTQDGTDEQGPSASASTATVIKRPEAVLIVFITKQSEFSIS